MTEIDPIAVEVAEKIARTRNILARVTDDDLAACRAGYGRLDNDSARAIVRLCDAEIAYRG